MKTEALKTGFDFGAVQEIAEGTTRVYVVAFVADIYFPFPMFPKTEEIEQEHFWDGDVFLDKDQCRQYCLYLNDKYNEYRNSLSNEE